MQPAPQLHVGVDRAELRPSETVSGTVTAPFRLDGFASARVDFGYETTELVNTSALAKYPLLDVAVDLGDLFLGGSRNTMKPVRRWVPVASAEFRLDELNAGRGRFQMAVPPQAPATAQGVATWLVWARAFRADGYQLGGSAAVRILRTAEPYVELGVINHEGEGSIDVVLQSVSARPAETIRGCVRLTIPKQLHVKRISAQLGAAARMSAHRLPTRYASLNAVEAVLCTDEIVAAGWREWPFELRVPAEAEPSSRTETAWQRWWVSAEVDYKGMGSKTNVARREVIIYNAP
jgi:hypothetical protein